MKTSQKVFGSGLKPLPLQPLLVIIYNRDLGQKGRWGLVPRKRELIRDYESL